MMALRAGPEVWEVWGPLAAAVAAGFAGIKRGGASSSALKEWRKDELNEFTGNASTILLAADGLVFDVSTARHLYGPGGKYASLAGRDATRFLGKNSLEEESEQSLALPLNMAEKAFLSAWVMSFKSKYPIVGKLVEEDLSDLNISPASLLRAAELGDAISLQRQVTKGADLHWTDGDGLQALHWAARQGHVAAVQALLDAGANVEGRDLKGRTALHWAATFGHVETVEVLIEKTSVEAAAADDWLPLHFAAQNGHEQVAQALIRNGADVNRTSKAGVTPLMGAARGGHRKAVELFLEAGADRGATVNGKTAQQWAENQGLNEIADLIASYCELQK